MTSDKCIIIGSGLSGLSAATELEKRGHRCILLEKDSEIGGKLKTEFFQDSYKLDHGFQVLLPAYPMLQEKVELKLLDLKYFKPGALVRTKAGLTKITDPLREPWTLFETLFSSIGTFKDKLLILKLRVSVMSQSEEQLLKSSQGTSLEFLKGYGFSTKMIDNFWKPFFSGIFLEDQLQTDANFLQFLFKMFSLSPVAVPALGIAELPKQMARTLKQTEIRLNQNVVTVTDDTVVLQSGEKLKGPVIDTRPKNVKQWGSVTTLYFASSESPIDGPYLYLNQNKKLVNHVAVMSEVSKDYAVKGDALISVNVLKPQVTSADFKTVVEELESLFGSQSKTWKFLKSFEIPEALPLYLNTSGLKTPSQQGAFHKAQALMTAGELNGLIKN